MRGEYKTIVAVLVYPRKLERTMICLARAATLLVRILTSQSQNMCLRGCATRVTPLAIGHNVDQSRTTIFILVSLTQPAEGVPPSE